MVILKEPLPSPRLFPLLGLLSLFVFRRKQRGKR